MKSIELTQDQIKSLKDGSNLLKFPIDSRLTFVLNLSKYDTNNETINRVLENFELKFGDSVWVKEDFVYHYDPRSQICGDLFYKEEEPDMFSEWSPAIEMTENHSRFKFKVLGINVEKVDSDYVTIVEYILL